MKRILLGLVALLSFLPLVAQDEHEYIPFVRDCEFGYYDYSGSEIEGFYHYWIEGEFEFDGKVYKGYYEDVSYPEHSYYIPKELLFYVREEDQKVYVWYEGKEYLWYDFTLEAGNWLWLKKGIFGLSGDITWKIKKVSEMVIGGKSRKSIELGEQRSWVEGLGDWNCLPGIAPFNYFPECPCGWKMFYVKENGEFVFKETHHSLSGNSEYNTPIIDPYLEGTGGIDATQEKTLQVITQGEQWIVTLPGDDYHMVEVIDTTGRVAWCEYIDGNANNINILATDLARGIYIVALTAESGERITAKVVK